MKIIMNSYNSQKRIKKNQQVVTLPKIKSQSVNLLTDKKLIKYSDNTYKKTKLLKQLRAVRNGEKQKDSIDLQSDSSTIMRKLMTPQKKGPRSQFQVAVLSLNKNPQQRLKKRMIKDIFVGEEAVQKYYEHYKHFDKQKQKQIFMKQDNPITHIIQMLQNHSFAPRRLDLIKLKGSHAILDLKKLGLGRGQMGNVVYELVNYLGQFDYIDLSSNCIDSTLSENIIEACTKCKVINLSYNRIGKIACDKFTNIFTDYRTNIQQLYLADNHLADNGASCIINSLVEYGNLRILDLNKNYMNHKSALALKQYLDEDRSLQELYLGWNQFGDKSAKLIFEGLQNNQTLKVLDYSWNVIGFFSVNSVAKSLKNNQNLLHVDISFCGIDKQNSEIIGKALQSNQTIYGMHFQGNSGYVDQKGYIKITPKQYKAYPLPIVKGIIRSIDSTRPNAIQNQYKQKSFNDICWICNSWQQMHLKFKKTQTQAKQCFVHFSSQNYKATKMLQQDGYYSIYRMGPISNITFFFTIVTQKNLRSHFSIPEYPQIQNNQLIKFYIGDLVFEAQINKLNIYDNVFTQDVIDENYFPNLHCQPRTHEVLNSYKIQTKKVIVKVKRKVIRERNLGMKFRQLDFKGGQDFLIDHLNRDSDEEYMLKCIEFDIRNSKITKILKDQQEIHNFKYMMIKYYRDFKQIFYYLSSTYPSVSGVYSVSELPFDSFLEQQKYITKRVTYAKIKIKMYSCLSTNDNQNASPQKKAVENNYKLFSRPQFLEFLIRLAIQKWCVTLPQPKNKKDLSPQKKNQNQEDSPSKLSKPHVPLPLVEGIQKTMKTLNKFAIRIGSIQWRKNKYLVIDNYTVIKGYEHFLLTIYQTYGGDKGKMDKPKKIRGFITLSECKKIMIDSGIKRTKQEAKDCDAPFLGAKRLQIQDGLHQFGLNFDQFCQFLARYSEVVWFPPVSCQNHQLWQIQQIRQKIPLFIRFQALIVNIYRKLSQFHNRRMKILTTNGLFQQQKQILLQKMQQIQVSTKSDLWMKINQGQESENLGLQFLIKGLKDRYQNVKVMRQQEISQQQERQQRDY